MLGVDFDGTLAPIVADPDQARPDAETLGLLQALASRLSRLVLISGRDTDQLWDRVRIPSLMLIGNHGLEERQAGRSRLSSIAEPFRPNLARAAEAIGLMQAGRPGIRIERKEAAISVHYRESDDPRAGKDLEALLRPLAAREHLRLHPGRQLWELRPEVEVHKGSVVRGLASSLHPRALIYVGDDVTDTDAFTAMRHLAGIRTLAVGVRSSEVAPQAFADCDLLVDGVDGVKALLRDLLALG